MKVGIYCRLSEEDRDKRNKTDDSGSIQNQKSMLVKYAYDRGWEIYKIYSDDDYTGSDRSRPAFNELLRDAEERRIDTVLCKTQSRFTRELELVERYIHGLFPRWGVRFVSVVDNADTEIKGNKKARQINGLINEWYLEDMSDNIRSVLTNRRQDGLHIGAFALYGRQKGSPYHRRACRSGRQGGLRAVCSGLRKDGDCSDTQQSRNTQSDRVQAAGRSAVQAAFVSGRHTVEILLDFLHAEK